MKEFKKFITHIEELEQSEDPINWLLADVLRKDRLRWLGLKHDERERMIKEGRASGFLVDE